MKIYLDKSKDCNVVDLSPQETEELNEKGWLFDTKADVLVLKDKENTYSVFGNIKNKVMDSFILHLNR